MLNNLKGQTESYQIFTLLRELDRGVIHHTAWLRDLHRGLICEELDKLAGDLLDDAHCQCRFGRWYQEAFATTSGTLLQDPAFIAIGVLHQEMHDSARDMLNERIRERTVQAGTYTRFMDCAIQFKLKVRQFQTDLIERVCIVDHLTGAWNRHAMHYKLAQERERLNRKGGECCLCMVDIDKFKEVNDRYGHPVGDVVLREVAGLLSRGLRKYDTVFRYGGEEFLLCLPSLGKDDALRLLERLRTEVAQTVHAIPGQVEQLQVTASFGVACISANSEVDLVIGEADNALMWAKADGRNCIRVWDRDWRKQEL